MLTARIAITATATMIGISTLLLRCFFGADPVGIDPFTGAFPVKAGFVCDADSLALDSAADLLAAASSKSFDILYPQCSQNLPVRFSSLPQFGQNINFTTFLPY